MFLIHHLELVLSFWCSVICCLFYLISSCNSSPEILCIEHEYIDVDQFLDRSNSQKHCKELKIFYICIKRMPNFYAISIKIRPVWNMVELSMKIVWISESQCNIYRIVDIILTYLRQSVATHKMNIVIRITAIIRPNGSVCLGNLASKNI